MIKTKKLQKIALLGLLSMSLFSGCSSKQQSKLIQIDPKKSIKELSQSVYEKGRKEELAKIIDSPVIPVKTPDKILRVLMLPHVDKNNILQTSSFLFVKVDEGRWIIGEYLNDTKTVESQTLSPLNTFME